MKNEELVDLRGGIYEYGYSSCCVCKDPNNKNVLGFMLGTTGGYDCYQECYYFYDRKAVGVYYC